jgi:2',3'-cyclic-nucleotide 2'-phosphodiesterase (5'-nucleotidase family)
LNKTYRIATNDFLAAGGDRFATFKDGQNISYGMDLRDAFLSYLKKRSPVQPRIEERIIILPTSYHHRQFPQRVSIQPFFSDLRPQLCFA